MEEDKSKIWRTNKRIDNKLRKKGFGIGRPLPGLGSRQVKEYWESDLTIFPREDAEYSNPFGEYDGKTNKWAISYVDCDVQEIGLKNLPQIRDSLELKKILDAEKIGYSESPNRDEVKEALEKKVIPELNSFVKGFSK